MCTTDLAIKMTQFPLLSNYSVPLTSTSTIVSVVGLLIITNVLHRFLRWRRLRHVPGPPLAGWTSLWLTRRYLNSEVLNEVRSLTAKYGPVVRVAPNKVVCSDIDALCQISNVRSLYRKDEWYCVTRISRRGENIVSLLDPEERRERKKFVGPAYTGRGGVNFEPGADRAIAAFLDLIERKYISTPGRFTPMDLGEKVHLYALDSIGEIAYSNPFGMLKDDKDIHGIIAANDATVPLIKVLGNHLWMWKALRKWPLYYLLPRDGDETGLGAVVAQINKIVDQRLLAKNSSSPKNDMLQSFISHGLQRDDVRQEVGIQFFAGTDTVAAVLRTTFLLLLTHPAVYTALQSELDTAFAQGRISTPIIRETEARALPYLEAVIRECLRLFPPIVIAPFWKEVPASATVGEGGEKGQGEGDTLCGVRLPPGTLVSSAHGVWVGNREEGFWGADAGVFRPERWLEEKDDEKLNQMIRRIDLAFGSGQFVCMGRAIAFIEIYKSLAELMRRYNWFLIDPLKMPKMVNPNIWIIHDFWVRIEKR